MDDVHYSSTLQEESPYGNRRRGPDYRLHKYSSIYLPSGWEPIQYSISHKKYRL